MEHMIRTVGKHLLHVNESMNSVTRSNRCSRSAVGCLDACRTLNTRIVGMDHSPLGLGVFKVYIVCQILDICVVGICFFFTFKYMWNIKHQDCWYGSSPLGLGVFKVYIVCQILDIFLMFGCM